MALTPMMEQYFKVKEQYPGHLLFYRLGDFYEMFFDDAKTASRELELTLTGRDCGEGNRAPMCGVPYHSVDNYIARLIVKGYKIAICEQMEDPATAKGLVKRDVVRIVTPGTVIESNMLSDSKNNYLASLFISDEGPASALPTYRRQKSTPRSLKEVTRTGRWQMSFPLTSHPNLLPTATASTSRRLPSS